MSHDFRAQLGHRLRELRKLKGLNQADLAARMGVSRAALSLIEKGSTFISGRTLDSLCRSLDMPPHRLFEFEGGLPTLTEEVMDMMQGCGEYKRRLVRDLVERIIHD